MKLKIQHWWSAKKTVSFGARYRIDTEAIKNIVFWNTQIKFIKKGPFSKLKDHKGFLRVPCPPKHRSPMTFSRGPYSGLCLTFGTFSHNFLHCFMLFLISCCWHPHLPWHTAPYWWNFPCILRFCIKLRSFLKLPCHWHISAFFCNIIQH